MKNKWYINNGWLADLRAQGIRTYVPERRQKSRCWTNKPAEYETAFRCASVSLPPAKGYSVQVGDKMYLARSVKIHGSWIEMETENGPVWANSVVSITPKD